MPEAAWTVTRIEDVLVEPKATGVDGFRKDKDI